VNLGFQHRQLQEISIAQKIDRENFACVNLKVSKTGNTKTKKKGIAQNNCQRKFCMCEFEGFKNRQYQKKKTKRYFHYFLDKIMVFNGF